MWDFNRAAADDLGQRKVRELPEVEVAGFLNTALSSSG